MENRKMELNNTLFVLDTETGGVDSTVHSLMEFAGIVIRDGKVIDKYSAYVKSVDGKYICTEFARKLHKITDEIANNEGKLPVEIVNDLIKIRDKHFKGSPMTIVAHNAAFDIAFVKKMFSDAQKDLSDELKAEFDYGKVFSRNAIDTATMALVLRLQGKLPFDRCSLDNILKFYDIEIVEGERHSALADATATAQAFNLMFNDLSNVKEKQTLRNGKDQDEYDVDFDDEKKLR